GCGVEVAWVGAWEEGEGGQAERDRRWPMTEVGRGVALRRAMRAVVITCRSGSGLRGSHAGLRDPAQIRKSSPRSLAAPATPESGRRWPSRSGRLVRRLPAAAASAAARRGTPFFEARLLPF